jgi:hypothetical protein
VWYREGSESISVEGSNLRAMGQREAAGSCSRSRACLLRTRQMSYEVVPSLGGSVEVLQGRSGSTVGLRLPCLAVQDGPMLRPWGLEESWCLVMEGENPFLRLRKCVVQLRTPPVRLTRSLCLSMALQSRQASRVTWVQRPR